MKLPWLKSFAVVLLSSVTVSSGWSPKTRALFGPGSFRTSAVLGMLLTVLSSSAQEIEHQVDADGEVVSQQVFEHEDHANHAEITERQRREQEELLEQQRRREQEEEHARWWAEHHAEEERRRVEEEEQRKREEEEQRQREEEQRLQREEEERQRLEIEQRRQQEEEEHRKRQAEEADLRKKQEEEEAHRRRQQEEEALLRRLEEEINHRRRLEEEEEHHRRRLAEEKLRTHEYCQAECDKRVEDAAKAFILERNDLILSRNEYYDLSRHLRDEMDIRIREQDALANRYLELENMVTKLNNEHAAARQEHEVERVFLTEHKAALEQTRRELKKAQDHAEELENLLAATQEELEEALSISFTRRLVREFKSFWESFFSFWEQIIAKFK